MTLSSKPFCIFSPLFLHSLFPVAPKLPTSVLEGLSKPDPIQFFLNLNSSHTLPDVDLMAYIYM